jgi:hypothetical protein
LGRLGRYRRWSIRVSSLTLAQVTRLALSEGWEISDLTRALVVFAATATWLALENQKNVDILRAIGALGRMRNALSKRIPGSVQKRPYPLARDSQDTAVMTLILPADIAELLESFAAAKIISKNDLCGTLLTKGLIMYLTAKQRLLQALQNQRRRAEEPSAAR